VPSLVTSIRDGGLLQPIGLTPDFELVYGRHRLEACKSLGYEKIPAVILSYKDQRQYELAEIDENLQRHALTPLEESQALAGHGVRPAS
jgi:ParB family transcriptional regulator, chromosome partitioning protein